MCFRPKRYSSLKENNIVELLERDDLALSDISGTSNDSDADVIYIPNNPGNTVNLLTKRSNLRVKLFQKPVLEILTIMMRPEIKQ